MRWIFALALTFALLAPALALRAKPGAVSIGLDLGTTAMGLAMDAGAAALSFELPQAEAWALDLEPSFYAASGTTASTLQLNLAALCRFYLVSPPKDESAAQQGTYLAAGALASCEWIRSFSPLFGFAIGPILRAGYRIAFSDRRLYLDLSASYSALFGGRSRGAEIAASISYGPAFGFVAGWRF